MSILNLCHSDLLRQGLRVLIVDGNLDSRELIMMVFAEYGVETITAASVSEALELIQQTPIDLVISEILLPGEDGYSLVRKLKALHVQIPAIALTVLTSNNAFRQSLAAGFCRHVAKPLDLNQFIETVASVMQQVQVAQAATA